MLNSQVLLDAYRYGVFPMAETASSSEVIWIEPQMRGIIPLKEFHIPRSLKKIIRKAEFTVTANACFKKVVTSCANRPETWINEAITESYTQLHKENFAHSIEVWKNGALVGGLYGVHIGAAFFGESMFSVSTNASKIALVYLVARLKAGGFQLLDTQFTTDHLEQFGTQEIPQKAYKHLLAAAVTQPGDFSALSASEDPEVILQFSSQIS